MSDIKDDQEALVARILDGKGNASLELRRCAFDNAGLDEPLRTLVHKVSRYACTVKDGDIASARTSGLSEDQIFEVVVSAAVGEAKRQYNTALAALDDATEGA
jgi:hypothetical protein